MFLHHNAILKKQDRGDITDSIFGSNAGITVNIDFRRNHLKVRLQWDQPCDMGHTIQPKNQPELAYPIEGPIPQNLHH
jgi:hypothetical protein